jgi:hypothetical protein
VLRSRFLASLRLRLRCRRSGHDFVGYLHRSDQICWRCGKPRALPQAWDRPQRLEAQHRPDRDPAARVDEDPVQETFQAFWLASNRYEDGAEGSPEKTEWTVTSGEALR